MRDLASHPPSPLWLSLFLSEPQEMELKRKMWSPSFMSRPFLEQLSHSEFHIAMKDKSPLSFLIDKTVGSFMDMSHLCFKIKKEKAFNWPFDHHHLKGLYIL